MTKSQRDQDLERRKRAKEGSVWQRTFWIALAVAVVFLVGWAAWPQATA